MNQPTTISEVAAQPMADTRRLPRLRFPFVCLLVYWVLGFIVGGLNKPYFVGFMYGLASAGLLTLLFLSWWWFHRGLRLWEKAAGFGLMLAEAFVVGKLSHHSVTAFTLWTLGLPLVSTVVVGWLFLVETFNLSRVRTGFVALGSVTWACFLVFRIEGLDSSLKLSMHWRWTPSPEEMFLARSTAQAKGQDNKAGVGHTPSGPDWVAFRGPQRDGVIVGSSISTNWTANPPALVWKRDVGPAWSSLLLVGNRLFTQEQRGEKETVVCYDATSGEQIWVHEEVARFEEQVSGPGPRATPTFANGRLFALGGTGLLNCLEADTGRCVWKRDIKSDSGAKVPMWAFAGSPLVTGDLLIVYAGGDAGKGLLAYRVGTGELGWATEAGGSSYSSPQLTVLDGVPQCLMLQDAGLTAVDVVTGKKLWETGVAMKGAPRCGQPRLIGSNQLLVASLGGLGTALIEVSTNAGQWQVITKWDSKDLKPEFPDFVVHDGYAYGFDIGIFCCLNLKNGKRTWKEGRYGRGEVMLLRDQGLLLISSETGELVLLAADPAAHRELGRFQALDGKTWNHPVVRGDQVYLRNGQQMASYSLSARPAKMASR